MSGGRNRRQMTSIKSSDDLIVIDSDDEDEVIFVNEDGGSTLAQSETLVTPGFLENLPKHNEPEVRSLFDNVVKIQAELEPTPIIIERTFTVSPSQEFDEEQIELPNYNVQFFNKLCEDQSHSNTPDQRFVEEDSGSNSNEPSKLNISDEPSELIIAKEISNPTITNETSKPVIFNEPSKPIIKLAPLSKLVDKQAFVSLDQMVTSLGVTPPVQPQKRTRKKRDDAVPIELNSSPVKMKNFKNQLPTSNRTELDDKLATLQKYIPGGSSESWPKEYLVKKTIEFIMELRKSDCELDIAEEALMQSNIKLNMDYEEILERVYNLCPKDEDEPESRIPRITRNKIKKEASDLNVEQNDMSVSGENQSRESNVESTQAVTSNEECLLLNNLLGEVRESAKSHLLNFDPDIPFDDFLPSNLLSWDHPKSKTDILDEIMYLENAISKCSNESEEIRKVSHQQEIFKYEDLFDTFKKEFNLDLSKNLDEDVTLKNEVENQNDNLIVQQTSGTVDEGSDSTIKTINDKKPDSPPKRKKRRPWNKGMKGVKRKYMKSHDDNSSNYDAINLDSDRDNDLATNESINSNGEDEEALKPAVNVDEQFAVDNKLENSMEQSVQPERVKRKYTMRKRRSRKSVKIIELEEPASPETNNDDLEQPPTENVEQSGATEESLLVKEEMDDCHIEEEEDEIPLDKLKRKLKKAVIKLAKDDVEKIVKDDIKKKQEEEEAEGIIDDGKNQVKKKRTKKSISNVEKASDDEEETVKKYVKKKRKKEKKSVDNGTDDVQESVEKDDFSNDKGEASITPDNDVEESVESIFPSNDEEPCYDKKARKKIAKKKSSTKINVVKPIKITVNKKSLKKSISNVDTVSDDVEPPIENIFFSDEEKKSKKKPPKKKSVKKKSSNVINDVEELENTIFSDDDELNDDENITKMKPAKKKSISNVNTVDDDVEEPIDYNYFSDDREWSDDEKKTKKKPAKKKSPKKRISNLDKVKDDLKEPIENTFFSDNGELDDDVKKTKKKPAKKKSVKKSISNIDTFDDTIKDVKKKNVKKTVSNDDKLISDMEEPVEKQTILNEEKVNDDCEETSQKQLVKKASAAKCVSDDIPDSPAKRRKSLRAKFVEGARTTRSFVKRCSEVMDKVDREMEILLRTDKRVDREVECYINYSNCKDENHENKESENDKNQMDESFETDNDDKQVENVEDPIEKSEKNTEIITDNDDDNKDITSENVEEETKITENVDFDPNLTGEVTQISPIKIVTPKKKKKYFTGKSKRRPRKPKGKVSSNVVDQPQIEEPNETVEHSLDENLKSEKALGENITDESLTQDKIDDVILENKNSSMTKTANNCEIDNSIKDNFEVKQKESNNITDEEKLIQLKTSDNTVNDKSADCFTEISNSPTSPLALTVNVTDSCKKDENSLVPDSPLDFSIKNTETKTPIKSLVNSSPLNLSNKNDPTSSSGCVIDFSIKKDGCPDEVKVVEEQSLFNLTKSSMSFNEVNYLSIVNEKPKSAFSSGKQIFTDPKDFNVTPVLNTSIPPVAPLPLTLSDVTSLPSSVSSPAPPKDNIINELTDFLADLADNSTQQQLNFDLENSSENKTTALVPPLLPQSNVRSVTETGSIPSGLNIVNNEEALSSKVNYSNQLGVSKPSLNADQSHVRNFANFSSGNDSGFGNNSSAGISSIIPTQYPNVGSNVRQIQNYANVNQPVPGNILLNNQSQPFNQIGANTVQRCDILTRPSEFSNKRPSNFVNPSQYDQTSNQIVPYDPLASSKLDQTVTNMNDPRLHLLRQLSQDSSSDGEKSLVPFGHQSVATLRDPRIAKKIMSDRADSPFSGNLQINQLISEVIKQNNFENFLMDSRSGQMIMNQNLELDEEDLNLNRSDFDDFASDTDEGGDEGKQRQTLLRKSIDKLIVTDLKEPAQSVSLPKDTVANKDSDSSDESLNNSSFTRRVIRSPPMVRKSEYSQQEEYIEQQVTQKKTRQSKQVDSSETDACERKSLRRTRSKVKYTEDSDENSNISSEYEMNRFKSKSKKKLSMKVHMKKDKQKRSKSSDDEFKLSRDGPSDDDGNSFEYKNKSGGVKRGKKRIIDSDDDSLADKLSRDDSLNDKHYESDSRIEEDRSELSDDVSDHLKRVSDIKHRKLESKEKKIVPSKREPQIRRMKFLDELPDTEINPNKELVSPSHKKHPESNKSMSKLERHLLHKRDDSPKSTSRVVRKTITTERIVTKRIADSTSPKKLKTGPEKEKKVYVQERITLKVNERSKLDRRGGINFKCDALKEGEILKVVGGKLVRVRKRVSNSDEEIERERSKLQKCLTSFKIKKKSDKRLAVEENPYNVLKEDGKSITSEVPNPSLQDIKMLANTSPSSLRNRKYSEEQRMQHLPENSVSPVAGYREKNVSPVVLGLRSSSLESSEDVKTSPRPRLADPRRLSRGEGTSPRNLSPGHISRSPIVSSSPKIGHFEHSDSKALAKRQPHLPATSMSCVDVPGPNTMSLTGAEASRVDSYSLSSPSRSKQIALKQSMEVAGKSEMEMMLADSEVAKSSRDVVPWRADVEMPNCNTGVIARKANLDVARLPDMELAKRSDFEPPRSNHMEVARSFEYVSKKSVESNRNEMFTRRESFTERRKSREGFSRREFSREETSVSEWTDKKKGERSILGMFQRGEISVWDGSRSEERNWNPPESRGNVFNQNRNETLPSSRDPRLNSGATNFVDSGPREWKDRLSHPSREEGGSDVGRNSRDERPRGQNPNRPFQPTHTRNDPRSFMGQNDQRPFHHDNRHREERQQFRDSPPFCERDERQSFRDRDERRPPFRRDERNQTSEWSRQNDWQPDHQQQRFRGPGQGRDSSYNEDRDYRRSPERYRRNDSNYKDCPVPPIQDRRMEINRPQSLFNIRASNPAHPPAFSTSRPSWI